MRLEVMTEKSSCSESGREKDKVGASLSGNKRSSSLPNRAREIGNAETSSHRESRVIETADDGQRQVR